VLTRRADLDASTRHILARGERLTELLKQAQYSPLAFEVQVPLLYAGVNGMLDKLPVNKIGAWEHSFLDHLKSSQSDLLKEISGGKMTPELDKKIRGVCERQVALSKARYTTLISVIVILLGSHLSSSS